MLEIRELTRSYGSFLALDHLNMTIGDGGGIDRLAFGCVLFLEPAGGRLRRVAPDIALDL